MENITRRAMIVGAAAVVATAALPVVAEAAIPMTKDWDGLGAHIEQTIAKSLRFNPDMPIGDLEEFLKRHYVRKGAVTNIKVHSHAGKTGESSRVIIVNADLLDTNVGCIRSEVVDGVYNHINRFKITFV
jgi:hypothetical protein